MPRSRRASTSSSRSALPTDRLDNLRESLGDATELVVKTGVLPRELLELAWDEPARWAGPDGRLVVHWPGTPGLRVAHQDALEQAAIAAGIGALSGARPESSSGRSASGAWPERPGPQDQERER